MNYDGIDTPDNYLCNECGAKGCKLWRQYQTFVDHTRLLCVDCAAKDQDKPTAVDARPDGTWPRKAVDGRVSWTDQIGWLVPAVPTPEEDTFWGYTSVPADGCAWWARLPLRPGDKPNEKSGIEVG